MCQLENCLVSETISLYQVLKLPLTSYHKQIILISVPVGDLISSLSLFFSEPGSFEISLSTIPLSYCQEGKET